MTCLHATPAVTAPKRGTARADPTYTPRFSSVRAARVFTLHRPPYARVLDFGKAQWERVAKKSFPNGLPGTYKERNL